MMQTVVRNHVVTMEEERKVWSIHRAVNGMTYYYNRSTKKSQYQMPECFKTTEQILEHPEWREYRTAEGKKFYYNSLTKKSVWQVPNEVKEWRAKLEEARLAEQQARKEDEAYEESAISEEQKKKFLSLLKDKHIDMNCKWDACIARCEDDDRWRIMRTSEKRKLFQEYVIDCRKQDELLRKAKLEAHKADFLKMLMDCKSLSSDSKMHKVTLDFANDRRWRALDEMERENVFQMYMDMLVNKQREEAQQKAKEHAEALKKQLRDMGVSSRTKWEAFRQMFAESENYKNLHNLDRLTTFTEYIGQLEKLEQEEQNKEKQARQRNNRQKFRQLLAQKVKSGQITHKTRWPRFVRENKDQRALIQMMDQRQQGSSPHELFEDLMEGIRQNHKNFKSLIKTYFKTSSFKITAQTTQQAFEQKLQGVDQFWALKPVLREYFYVYFKNKVKGSQKKTNKKEKKAIFKVFKQIKELKGKTNITDHIPKIMQQLRLQGQNSFTNQSIQKYFEQYQATEANEEDDRKKSKRQRSDSSSGESSEEDRKKKKKKDRRRNDSDSSDEEEDPKPRKKKQQKQQTDKKQVKSPQAAPVADFQEQGEIKDDGPAVTEDKHRKREKSSRHKHKKSRRKTQSSDSD